MTLPITQTTDTLFNSFNTFTLMAIPFFVFAANINKGRSSKR
jgi:TRAP-type C4-dicarboxylate transport system permease large subunit